MRSVKVADAATVAELERKVRELERLVDRLHLWATQHPSFRREPVAEVDDELDVGALAERVVRLERRLLTVEDDVDDDRLERELEGQEQRRADAENVLRRLRP